MKYSGSLHCFQGSTGATIVPATKSRQYGTLHLLLRRFDRLGLAFLPYKRYIIALFTNLYFILNQYGLIGYPLGHSFSQRYFTEKFEREGIGNARYDLFPLPDIADLPELIAANPDLRGLNVTIPHKVAVIPYLHEMDETATAIGAVNVIRIRNGLLSGFNTDVIGFERSLNPWLNARGRLNTPLKALILGTGGASKAVAYVLQRWGVAFQYVSRNPQANNHIAWSDLQGFDFAAIHWIFNTTPLGTYPKTATCPDLPFEQLGAQHLVYDLVYNPPETLLLQRAKARGCAIKNGLEMLQLQAEAAWEIWFETSTEFPR